MIEVAVAVLPVRSDERRNLRARQTVEVCFIKDALRHVVAVCGADDKTAGRELAREELEQVERAPTFEMRDERAAPDQIEARVERQLIEVV